MSKDHYKTLEITNKASLEEIKKAYKNLAVKWHPDKNKNPNSLQKFKEISESYQILCKEKQQEIDNNSYIQSNFNVDFEQQDPFELFNEFFSMINCINNTIKGFDTLMNTEMIIHIFDDIVFMDNLPKNNISNLLNYDNKWIISNNQNSVTHILNNNELDNIINNIFKLEN